MLVDDEVLQLGGTAVDAIIIITVIDDDNQDEGGNGAHVGYVLSMVAEQHMEGEAKEVE